LGNNLRATGGASHRSSRSLVMCWARLQELNLSSPGRPARPRLRQTRTCLHISIDQEPKPGFSICQHFTMGETKASNFSPQTIHEIKPSEPITHLWLVLSRHNDLVYISSVPNTPNPEAGPPLCAGSSLSLGESPLRPNSSPGLEVKPGPGSIRYHYFCHGISTPVLNRWFYFGMLDDESET
jgi:hypothetical protein